MPILGEVNAAQQNQAAQTAFKTASDSKETLGSNQFTVRYQDSYKVAKVIDTFGGFAKIAGYVSAGIICFIGLLLTFVTIASYSDSGVAFVVFLIAITLGAVVGAFFYILGLVLSALGQNLMAVLDTAVNTSPYLNQNQKVKLMS